VLERVGQGFLHDAVRGHADRHGDPPAFAFDEDVDAEPRGLHLLHERVMSSRPGCGASISAVPGSGRSTDTMRLISAIASRPVRSIASSAVAAAVVLLDHSPRGGRLHRHDADAVGDHVMKLARQALTLHRCGLEVFLLLECELRDAALGPHNAVWPPQAIRERADDQAGRDIGDAREK